ncbi:PREDICTED: uncharacterized protein LOC108660633 [Theobroma cacao]|uniref:Uncharacterized protein LOC108660633 n=1 Tax=Theobroma cacao TaxID=3641 RepID=A0AB32VV66_THECC|nr:PREDICTED: uncharacterized protein LOC108660633 [Theobroma cacao]
MGRESLEEFRLCDALNNARVLNAVRVTTKLPIRRESRIKVGLFYKKFNIKGESSPPKYPDHIHELVALLIMWLARYVFPSCPDDGISSSIIPYAIKIAKGMSFPLAPLYLGSLYRRLDLYHSKTAESVGRYRVLTYVDVFFIHMCLWERFRSCAPTSNVYQPPVSFSTNTALRDNYRAWAWHDQNFRDNILKVLDKAYQFIARLYVRSNHGFSDPIIYYDRRPFKIGKLSSHELNFLMWVNSSQPPSMIETASSGVDRDSLSIKLYFPYRVACQFGYDQSTLPRPPFLENFSSYTFVFLLHVPSISNNEVTLHLIHSKRNKTPCQEESILSAEVERQDITDFLPSTIQSVGGDEVNDITGVSDGDVDAATRVDDDDVNATNGVGDDDVGDANEVGGDDGTFGVTRSIQNNFGIDGTLGATRNIFSFEGVPNISRNASFPEGVLNTTCNGSSSRGVPDSIHNSSSSLRERRNDASDSHLEDFHGIPVMP